MNPNHMPYGQHMSMQPPPRRHDGSYAPMPAHVRSHPGYQPYYPQQMGPMMPQYPQHYAPNWYPYQQQHMHPVQQRPHYYPQSPIPPPQYPQHYGATVSPNQHIQPQPSPRLVQTSSAQQPPPSSTSTTSPAPVQTPPSPPLSTSTAVSARKEPSPRSESPAQQRVQTTSIELPAETERFAPPIPWLSIEGSSFPQRAARQRRRILRSQLANEPITYPIPEPSEDPTPHVLTSTTPKRVQYQHERVAGGEAERASIHTPTPLTSEALPEAMPTQPTTPSSVAHTTSIKSQQTPTQPKSRPAAPIIPAVPVLPQSPNAARKAHRDSVASNQSKATGDLIASTDRRPSAVSAADSQGATSELGEASTAAPQAKPTSWANLFRSANAQPAARGAADSSANTNGAVAVRSEALSDVLQDMSLTPEAPSKVSFLQPRGLVNTGNMCYMNSVLQVLVFCIPFYDFLSKVASRATHTFKSDTPLVDAVILFMQEYAVLDSAASADQIRLRLKPEDYEKYGDSFIPEYVYAAIKSLPRFREMRRGHQQDAQEFLGFLLEELHEECSRSLKTGTSVSSGRSTPLQDAADNESGWMEVGHKQKPAVTRSSGAIVGDSPITSIFGGKLRSELKISGNKMSVTLEPYSPLQLDIGSPEVGNIVDALKGLTRPESMQGDFVSARGQAATATKQVFIETLPPVLILHLKRFHYDNTSKRAEKIWKKVGYPLELEIPKEVFPVSARNKFAAHGGLPRYRLTGVIYHHGKNANGGHYTVDIRRQDGKEWIRLDDTLIRRVRNEDVAEGGAEEDPKVLAAALERHRQGKAPANRFEQIEQEEEEEEGRDNGRAWNQVNGHSRSKSTMSAVANGTATPHDSGPQTPRDKFSGKDSKVAYLLFYQRVSA